MIRKKRYEENIKKAKKKSDQRRRADPYAPTGTRENEAAKELQMDTNTIVRKPVKPSPFTWGDVRIIFRGEAVCDSQLRPNSICTWSYLVDSEQVTPVPVSNGTWIPRITRESLNTLLPTLPKTVASMIQVIQDSAPDKRLVFGFEQFHACWEVLTRISMQDERRKELKLLGEYYKHPFSNLICGALLSNDVTIKLRKDDKARLRQLTHHVDKQSINPEKSGVWMVKDFCSDTTEFINHSNIVNAVILPVNHNSFFEILIVSELDNGDRFVQLIQSLRDYKTGDKNGIFLNYLHDRAAVIEKSFYPVLQDETSPLFGIKKENVMILMLCLDDLDLQKLSAEVFWSKYRESPQTTVTVQDDDDQGSMKEKELSILARNELVPKQIVVLTLKDLKRLYGPTLEAVLDSFQRPR